MQSPPTQGRRRSRAHSGSGGSGSSVGSSSTASSRSSSSSGAERRRRSRARTADLKRKHLPRLRGLGKRGVRPGGDAPPDPLPYAGPRRLSYIPESSAEWDDDDGDGDDVEHSSHDGRSGDGSMDTDDMEARLEELEVEARRSSGLGLEDDGGGGGGVGVGVGGGSSSSHRRSDGTRSRSDFDVPLEDSLDDFMRRKSRRGRNSKVAAATAAAEEEDGADVSGVWSNVANEFGSVVPGGGGERHQRGGGTGTNTAEGSSLPSSLDLTEQTGNSTSGRNLSLEYSWSSSSPRVDGGGGGGANHRPTPPRPSGSGSGSGYSSTDSWGAPRVGDDQRKGKGAAAVDPSERPHDRLHRMSTGDLSYDTWGSSSSGVSYGGDGRADDGDGGNGGDDGGRNKEANGGDDGGDDGDDEDCDHRSSISTNDSAHRKAAATAAAAAMVAAAATASAAGTGARDGSPTNMGGADAAAGLGSSDHGGPLAVVGENYMIGLNDVVDASNRSDGTGRDADDKKQGKDEDDDVYDDDDNDERPYLNPHDRLHHMSTDALSCDTSGWDSNDFDNIDEMGPWGKADEGNQRQEADEQRRPHNRLHRMSIDDMTVESGSQASRSYDSRADELAGDGKRASRGGGDDPSAAAQSTSAASWVPMSRMAQSIVNDVVNSIKGTGKGAGGLTSSAPEQEHEEYPDIGIYEEDYLEDGEAYGDGAAGMGYGETYDLDGKELSRENRSVKRHLAQRSSRPDNYGAERLHQMSMHTIDADDLSSATPTSARGTAHQSAIQLDPSGSVSYYESDVVMSPETKKSSQNVFQSLGESIRRLTTRSSVPRMESHDKVTPTSQEVFEEYDNEDYDEHDGYSHGETSYNEMEHSAKPSRSKRESWFTYIYHHMCYFLLGTCLLLGTIILIVFLVKRDDGGFDSAVDTASQGDSNSSPKTKDGNSPSIPRTPAEIRRKGAIQTKLVEMDISDISAFNDASTPQKMALEWLCFDDDAQLDANDQYLSSRYSLAVFYMSAELAKNGEHRQQDLFEVPVASEQVDDWIDSSNWMSSAGFCSWSGIECVPRLNNPEETKFDGNGEITHFVLPSNNIHSSLPSELFSAFGKSLRVLDLSDNRLTSGIPDEINLLAKIETLDLSRNALTGRMPGISSLHALQTLRLGSNKLSGKISPLEELEALVAIDLQSNDFTGEFDLTKLHKAINLKELRVNDNGGLTGVLPYQFGFFGFMSNVEILDMSGNLFDGTMPRAIKNMKGLIELDISRNMFTGELPDTLGELYEMRVLDISDNQFEGISMPSSICELKDNHNLNVLVADCRDDFGGGINAKVFCTCCTECL